MDREERGSRSRLEQAETEQKQAGARPLDDEWQAAMERLGTTNRGDAFLAEAVARAEQLVDTGVEEYRCYKAQGMAWRQRREELGMDVHDLAGRIGVSSLDLWFLEGGLPPLSRSREDVAADLVTLLEDS